MEELNLLIEAQRAIDLNKNAKNYRVALPIEVGVDKANPKRGVSIIYEVAPGVQLNQLTKMLQVFNESPQKYFTEYDECIKQHPWLRNPEKWMHELPKAYLKAQNEQFLFIGPDQSRVSHADPHTGNVFIDFQNGRLMPTYIDTGLTVTRNTREVINHLGFCTDLILGNSRGIAKRVVENAHALPQGSTKEALIDSLTEQFDKTLFRSGNNLNDFQNTISTLKSIIIEAGIIDSPTESLFLKAEVQSLMTYRELSKSVGQQHSHLIKESIGDVCRGLLKALVSKPSACLKNIYETMKHFLSDPYHAIRTAAQFV